MFLRKDHILPTIKKMENVITSCETKEQLKTGMKYCELLINNTEKKVSSKVSMYNALFTITIFHTKF